nr:AsmA-like C-terminal region-containing protein [Verticiella sp. GG226]
MGQVRVAADNVGTDGHRWHVRELSIVNRDAALSAHGSWEPVNGGTRRRTTLDVSVEVHDAGGLLGRLGFNDVVAGGKGHVKGSVGWAGAPFSYDVAQLDAHAGVALDEGRFLQTDNTAGRLLGLLSLQTLARAATFSEGNLFAAGFAWDTLRSEVSVGGGVARIDSFQLHGASATAVLSGTADLVRERADLRAVIVPHVDASGAALLAGLAVNPVLGAGAFLAQWLLQKPISEALTMQYAVTGPWSGPQVTRIDR